jgi:hypothetical protein
LARREPRAACSEMVRPALPVGAFAGSARPAFRSAPAAACPSRQAWRLLGRLARLELGEAAGRLARHGLRAVCSAMVRPVGSEARPAMSVGAFAGLAPPAFRPAPATACRSRWATRDRAANRLTAMLPAGRGAPLARAGRGFSPEVLNYCLQLLSPSGPRTEVGRLSRRSPPPPRQLQHLPPSADPSLRKGSANPD